MSHNRLEETLSPNRLDSLVDAGLLPREDTKDDLRVGLCFHERSLGSLLESRLDTHVGPACVGVKLQEGRAPVLYGAPILREYASEAIDKSVSVIKFLYGIAY